MALKCGTAVGIFLLVTFLVRQVDSFVSAPMYLRNPSSWESPKLQHLYVKCDRNGLLVNVTFDNPFNGIIYSMGHDQVPECRYVSAANGGKPTYQFLIHVNMCGTRGQYRDPKPGEKVTISNTVIIQHDYDLMTAEDSAHSLSCSWADSYVKPVTTNPIKVMESNDDVVPVVLKESESVIENDRFDPQYNIASGLIQDNQEKSVLVTIMDPFNQYDATVLDCLAFDRTGSFAVALTDKNGCMLQLKVMPPFRKTRDPGVGLIFTSTIKDQRLAQNKNLAIKCNVQVCPGRCPTPCVFPGTQSKSIKTSSKSPT